MIGPVNLRDPADDQQSLRGEMTYHPVYTYYGTQNRKSTNNGPITQPSDDAIVVDQPTKSSSIDTSSGQDQSSLDSADLTAEETETRKKEEI